MANIECRTGGARLCPGVAVGSTERRPTQSLELLYNLERGTLPVTRSRAGEQCADCLDRLAVAPNDSAHIRLPQLHPEDRDLS